MNHIFMGKLAWKALPLSFLLGMASCAGQAPDVYYLDATGGNDASSGLSPEQAWKTLNKASGHVFRAGEKLLLKRGEVFEGELEITGKGTPGRRIVIGSYGEDSRKPCIAGSDTSRYAVRVFNSDYVTVQNLEITNAGEEALPGRTGLRLECRDYGISRSLTVRDVTVRDVNGSLVKEEGGGSGIFIVNGGDSIRSCFDSLTIENCHILRCARNAMIWSGYYDRRDWFPSKHTVIRHNLIEGVPGDGIVPIGCDSTLIEYNVMRDCPDVLPMTEAAAGIWPWSCDNTVVQFNEVSGHKAPWDAQGYDCDYNCTNTLIQYNYSHDNYGGLVLVCNSGLQADYSIGNLGSVVRYNVSIGDGIRPKETRQGMFSPGIHIAGPAKNTLIERNIVHAGAKPYAGVDRSMVVSDSWDGYADSTCFRQNVFYAAEESRFDMTSSTDNRFCGNWFLGEYKNLPPDGERKTASEVYQDEVLSADAKGYGGLHGLMEERTVCGEKAHFVSEQAIKAFFGRMMKE